MRQNPETRAPHPPRNCTADSTPTLPLGAHLVTERNGYEHHGIYVGGGEVVHYAGFAHPLRRGPVEKTTVDRFSAGYAVYIRIGACPKYDGKEIARRAGSRLGESNYRLLTNNCEHFCAWCLFGEGRSAQVEACLRSPLQAARMLFRLMLLLFCVQRKTALPQVNAA